MPVKGTSVNATMLDLTPFLGVTLLQKDADALIAARRGVGVEAGRGRPARPKPLLGEAELRLRSGLLGNLEPE